MVTNSDQPSSSYELVSAEQGQTWKDIDRQYVIDGFKQHGAVLLRGFPTELDDFVTFTDQFCETFIPNPSPTRTHISKRQHIQTVDHGDGYFPLHAERSQTPFRADIAFFHCRTAPRSGGQTFFCDGSLLASRFPDPIKEQLMPQMLLYRDAPPLDHVMAFLGITDPEQLEEALEEQGLDQIYYFKDEKLLMNFMTPALDEPVFGGDVAFANFLLFARFMLKKKWFPTFGDGSEIPTSLCEEIAKLAEPITTLVDWQPWDLLMLDNTRVMHGRMPIENVEERDILTRFGYANFS